MKLSFTASHRYLLLSLVFVFTALLPSAHAFADTAKAILVTGASTGSGRMIAETLAAKGHFVFAGARKDKDLEALNSIENIQSIRLDVTIQSEIDAAVQTVRKSGRGLYAVINNAGVGLMAPLIELEEDDLDFNDSLYKEEWESNWVLAGGDLSAIKGPEDIVGAVEHALFDPNPQQRYMVVGDPGRADRTMRALLRRMLELNENQAYTYDREDLIKLLDEEMASLQKP